MTIARSVVLATALTAIAGGLVLSPQVPDGRFVIAVVVVTLALLLRLRLRTSGGVFFLGWGEAALIIGLYLVPAGWLPLAFATGALLAMGLRAVFSMERTASPMVVIAASLSLASAVGAVLSVAVADPYEGPFTPAVAAGAALGALGYLVMTTVTTSVLAGLRTGASVIMLLRQALQHKLPMFAGNVGIGALVVLLAETDWRWLLGLPLALVLLHSLYASRLRASDYGRTWNAYADATRSLNHSDEDAVAVAGLRGAMEVFAVGRAELELGPDDRPRRWIGSNGQVRRADTAPPDTTGTAVPLLVSGDQIGILRIHLPRPATSSADERAMQAYADALAVALHDAVTHAELHELLARSSHDSQHDPLTGLLNRATLLAHGEAAMQLVSHAEPVALLLVDVDHFREINNTLGHPAGDEVLRVTAARLQAETRPGELLARLGGDEFALLIPHGGQDGAAATRHRAIRRGRELVGRLARRADVSGVAVSIETTVGVVVAPAGTADLSELLRRADTALTRAKDDGSQVGWYDSDTDPGSTDRPAVLAELREALRREQELVLLWQPVIDLTDGSPIGMEALVRWRHPRRGVLPPADFIRVVENSDLHQAFTEYVVDRALAGAAGLARRGLPIPVAVNLSARSLLDPQLAQSLAGLLRKHRVPGRRLVLEITETVMTRELPGIDEALARLRALGVRLAVDDFGTGYASLTFLTRVPLQEVKVDGGLVAKMGRSAEAAAIVRTTVELGRDLGLQVVAEGVETVAQEQMLVNLGCVAAQGFHFAEPAPLEQLTDTLRGLGSRTRGSVVPLRLPEEQAGTS